MNIPILKFFCESFFFRSNFFISIHPKKHKTVFFSFKKSSREFPGIERKLQKNGKELLYFNSGIPWHPESDKELEEVSEQSDQGAREFPNGNSRGKGGNWVTLICKRELNFSRVSHDFCVLFGLRMVFFIIGPLQFREFAFI